MKRTVVRYRTKPEQADANERLIAAVFEELRAEAPDGVRYLVLRLGDGTFLHFAAVEAGARSVTGLAAFQPFQAGIGERCSEKPHQAEAAIVGNYRMLGE
jgi:hypothetical protein